MKILIFEKSFATRLSLENQILFIDINSEITSIDNINNAISLLNEYYFDIIIIDMDNLKGKFQTLRRYALEKNPDVSLIMLTLYPYNNIIEKFLQGGVDHCFDKIVELDNFFETVTQIIKSETTYNENIDSVVNMG